MAFHSILACLSHNSLAAIWLNIFLLFSFEFQLLLSAPKWAILVSSLDLLVTPFNWRDQIIHHINIAVRCRKELDALKVLVPRIEAMNVELQEYRRALTSGRESTSPHHPLPSIINNWLNELNALLEEASDLAQHCTIPSYSHPFSRYTMSKKINKVTANLEKHVERHVAPLALLHQLHQDVALERIGQKIDSLNLRTAGDLLPSTSSAPSSKKYIEEVLIVGQDFPSKRLEEIIDSELDKKRFSFRPSWEGRGW
ncbi:hypothetical protein SUGI_0261810 [Cryptomeria japonica]|nr:hypothetical protein SUGI_0261810 [Cryptomeria japonica]